jgi:peptidoglycan/LPS O-acetylase OafA/YrhL
MPATPTTREEGMTVASLPQVRSHEAARPAAGSFYRPELDVLRFAAFLLVFLHHTMPRQGLIPHLGPQLSNVATSLAKSCGFGLCLFFALSAYLITELLIREKAARGKLDIKAFYIRRALRIWPLYFLGLGIGVAFALYKPAPGILERYAAYAVLAGNWYCAAHIASAGTSPMEILWSISVEEQFYLFWPWVAAARARRLVEIAAIGLLASSAAALIVIARIGSSTDAAWFNSFVEFGMFGAGAMLSLKLRGSVPRWGTALRVAVALAALALWFAASFAFHIKDPGPATSAFNLLAGYAAVGLGCVMLLLSVMGISAVKLPRALIYLGRISFGLYVFHVLGLRIAASLLHKVGPGSSGIVETLLGLAVTISLAGLSYHFYETPFLRLKKRLELVKSRPV